jgi:hypothetical protein
MDQKSDYQAEKWTRKVTMKIFESSFSLGKKQIFAPTKSHQTPRGVFGWWVAYRPTTQIIPERAMGGLF